MIAATLRPGLHVNLNLLETFLLVAELGSFTAASARSGRSTSAVSSQIKQLEDQLGVPLFVRTTRRVHLTEAGKVLAEAARKALAEIREGMARLQETTAAGLRRVAIGCSTSLAWQLVPSAIESYRARNPDTQVEVIEMPTSQMVEPLLAGEIAFGVGALDFAHEALDYETLLVEPMVALIPDTCPQSRLSSITLAELCRMDMILSQRPSFTRNVLEAEFARLGLTPNVKHDGVNFHVALAMVAAGHGVSVFSDLSSRRYRGQGFRRVPLGGEGISVRIGVLKARQRTLTKSQARLLDVVRREMAMRWANNGGPPILGSAAAPQVADADGT